MIRCLCRSRRTPAQIARQRAEQVAAILGRSVTLPDPEIDTTYELRGAPGAPLITMGSPWLGRWLFQRRFYHWFTLTIDAPTWLSPGEHVRPPRRTVFEWRDGEPGEPADVTVGAHAYVLEGLSGARRERALCALDASPFAEAMIVVDAIQVTMRFHGVDDLMEVVRRVGPSERYLERCWVDSRSRG